MLATIFQLVLVKCEPDNSILTSFNKLVENLKRIFLPSLMVSKEQQILSDKNRWKWVGKKLSLHFLQIFVWFINFFIWICSNQILTKMQYHRNTKQEEVWFDQFNKTLLCSAIIKEIFLFIFAQKTWYGKSLFKTPIWLIVKIGAPHWKNLAKRWVTRHCFFSNILQYFLHFGK